ncbi:hypothetical protein [Clostridium tagluense]|uniref:Uncharacterized protein n=1 Tax=Clostridium tagluense TaxID=360422 RepID=A0A401UMR9_9CLOT|nr:hypothetical protein [Clostridium tagluense]GCD10833.1 hypothetical protein Ctaglu_24560 [Clostridium tagluense]
MKKLFKSLIVVMLMGSATSTIDRFTGMHLYDVYMGGVVMYISYVALMRFNDKKVQAK